MIDYVVGGEFMNVTSSKGAVPYLNSNPNPMTGSLAFDSSTQSMKVFDGNNWQIVGGGSATVNLTPNAISILKWAEKKMFEEQELQALCDSSPAIKDLVSEMRSTMNGYINKIEMVKTLIKEEEKIATR
jgi:hypothetical protein